MAGLWHRLRRLFRRDEPTCQEVRERSSEYVDEELSGSLLQRFRQHLRDCQNCNAFVATLRATVLAVRNMPRQQAPPELLQRLQEQVRHQGQRPREGDASTDTPGERG